MKGKNLKEKMAMLTDKELRELALSKLKARELFPESNRIAREMLRRMKVISKGL